MSTSGWREHLVLVTRSDDGERIGYLRECTDGAWEPLNLLGLPVGDVSTYEDACLTVQSRAMASLIEPWWCRVSRPLTTPILDASDVDDDADWDRVVIAELTPDRALMRPMYAWPEESGCYLSVVLPANDILFNKEPVDVI